MTQASNTTGQLGEQIAQHVLQCKGFEIEAINWRYGRYGEVDLIAYHPQQKVLNFVEVKTRKSALFGAPAESVGPRKQSQLLALANAYLGQRELDPAVNIRFDVLSIFFPGQGRPAEVRHIENAFQQEF